MGETMGSSKDLAWWRQPGVVAALGDGAAKYGAVCMPSSVSQGALMKAESLKGHAVTGPLRTSCQCTAGMPAPPWFRPDRVPVCSVGCLMLQASEGVCVA